MHAAEPRTHLTRFYGEYSSVVRAKRRAANGEQLNAETDGDCDLPSPEERRRMRRSWSQLLKRVYEVNPLVCPDCGSEMRIISFILDPAVIDSILTHLAKNGIEPGRGPPGIAA